MSSYNFTERDGATPLDPDQIKGVRFSHLTTMGELDEIEDANIQKGLEWLGRQKDGDYLSTPFLCKLHEKLLVRCGTGQESFVKSTSPSRSVDLSTSLLSSTTFSKTPKFGLLMAR